MKTRIITNLFAAVLIMCLTSGAAFSQTTKQVKVSVSDSSGPLIGAGVLIQGTTNGAVTDADGNATLNVPQGGSLEISMIGYASQIIKWRGESSLSVILSEDSTLLDEVVFIGYGTAKKKDLTGSVVKADIETFKHAPNTSIIESLHGTVL